MRIFFICGSLEAGADGVGDYTRRLATQLIEQGHEIAVLALYDQFISDKIERAEIVENIELPVFRIPLSYADELRFKTAKNWINNFNPQWLSLQFVPFSFNFKGLTFGLGSLLKKLGTDRKWHIMFHELWVGMEQHATFKRILWGEIQKILIRNLIKKLNPKQIHTQTKLYQIQLQKLGYTAQYLPLFSNIPVVVNSTKESSTIHNQDVTFINFGTIHPGAQIEKFAKEAAAYGKDQKININIKLVGRCGSEQPYWIKTCEEAGLNILALEEQPAEQVSRILEESTFGISTTALPLIEKSGSVAAMHEHHLPVICIAKPWHARGVKNLPTMDGVVNYDKEKFNDFIKMQDLKIKEINIRDVSLTFIQDLV